MNNMCTHEQYLQFKKVKKQQMIIMTATSAKKKNPRVYENTEDQIMQDMKGVCQNLPSQPPTDLRSRVRVLFAPPPPLSIWSATKHSSLVGSSLRKNSFDNRNDVHLRLSIYE